ncbi:MAG: hypothetical protein U1E45_09100 [Geminicoccaceae bacterium]
MVWKAEILCCRGRGSDQAHRPPDRRRLRRSGAGHLKRGREAGYDSVLELAESPIPILPSDIAPLSLDSRARDMDLRPQNMEQALAAFQTFDKLPDPTMGQAAAQALMAKIFDDMSHATEAARTSEASLKQSGEGAQTAGKTAWPRTRRASNTSAR